MERPKDEQDAKAADVPAVDSNSEPDGWFTVQRAAELLGIAVPRIFDQIRDGKLQVRFETSRPGEVDRPLVTSAELKRRNGGADATTPTRMTAAEIKPVFAAPLAPPKAENAALDAARRTIRELESELRETRKEAEESEGRVDASLKAVYERDVKIARLEAEIAGHAKLREENDGFIRHLETRLDKTEERSEEKEKEIRRLAVGLGEARSEIRLLKPPPPEPPPAWKRNLSLLLVLLAVGGAGALLFWIVDQLGAKSFHREAGLTAGAVLIVGFLAGVALDRVRRSK